MRLEKRLNKAIHIIGNAKIIANKAEDIFIEESRKCGYYIVGNECAYPESGPVDCIWDSCPYYSYR